MLTSLLSIHCFCYEISQRGLVPRRIDLLVHAQYGIVGALELDPGYVDTAIRRWQTLTGDQAQHAATGRSSDDLAREAEAANAA